MTNNAPTVVAFVKGRLGSGQQVSAKLADVLHHGAVVVPDLLPELTGAELFPKHQCRSGVEAHAATPIVGRRMVQGQPAVVYSVLVANAKLKRKCSAGCAE